ncbi:MAG: alpha-amylase family glycosyl hydrolase [Candidatus Wallbacteria bacterium]
MNSEILFKNIYFDLTGFCVTPENPSIGGKATLKLLVNKKILNEIEKIDIRMTCDNEQHCSKMTIKKNRHSSAAVFAGTIPVLIKQTNIRFKIFTKNNIFNFNSRGVYEYEPNDYYDFKLISGNDSPKWVNKSVFYQIFPDRFHHGYNETEYRKKIDEIKTKFYELYGKRQGYFKDINPVFKKWGEKPNKNMSGYEFYFGTLAGISQKISYLKDLGINSIYLTPILKSPSNHRYDTSNYFEIDPVLGGNSGFKDFMKVMRKNKIKVILDAVYNHSGFSADIFEKARRGEKKYEEFFNFYDKKKHYACWLGHGNLPKLNYSSEKLRDYIYRSADSASSFWLNKPYEIDGYRLDVAHMIGCEGSSRENLEILRQMRQAFKSVKKDAFVLAENFFDSGYMLDGTSMDSVMNYHGFTFPVIHYIAGRDHRLRKNKINSAAFGEWLMEVYAKIPFCHANIMYNQLSSHDISRHNSIIGDDLRKILMAVSIQFTFPGIPSIFYGDEIGLTGVGDPECRASMEWNESRQNLKLKNAYKTLIEFRKQSNALAYGGFKILRCSDDIIIYYRKYRESVALLVINNNSDEKNLNIKPDELFLDAAKTMKVECVFDSNKISVRDDGLENEFDITSKNIKIKMLDYSSLIISIIQE